jgi:hypothetical protein
MTKIVTQPDVSGNASDRGWFYKHQTQTRRIRPFIEGEDYGLHDDPPQGFQPFTLVERLPSRALVRRFLLCHKQPLNDGSVAWIFIERKCGREPITLIDIRPNSNLANQISSHIMGDILDGHGIEEAHVRAVRELALVEEGGAQ